jgi:hypothetical protein
MDRRWLNSLLKGQAELGRVINSRNNRSATWMPSDRGDLGASGSSNFENDQLLELGRLLKESAD